MGQKVWTYKSRLWLLPGMFKYKWFSPYVISDVFPHRAMEVHSPQKNQTFKVNEHRVKPCIGANSTPRAPEPHLVDLKCTFPKG